MTNKRGMATWIWILIILIILAIGIGVYFFLNSGSDGGILSGSSIPKPPALPAG